MCHCCVPAASPEGPVELDQLTDITESVPVPLNAMAAADVDTMLIPGEVMVRDGGPEGGVVTGGVITGGVVTGGVAAACRVTVIAKDTELPAASLARTIIVFVPIARGMAETDQFTDPAAGPDPPWSLLHTTCTEPVPPLVVPLIAMDGSVVVTFATAGLAIVSVNTAGEGSEGGGVTGGITGGVTLSGLP